MAEQWLRLVPHSKKVAGSGLGPFCEEFVCSTCVCFFQLLPLTKKMHIRFIGSLTLFLDVVENVNNCSSRLSLCGPMIDVQPVQPHFLHRD